MTSWRTARPATVVAFPRTWIGLSVVLALGCGSAPREDDEDATGVTGEETGFDPIALDVAGGDAIDPAACGHVSDTAFGTLEPADILIIVDNSPSMVLEARAVQQNLNEFSRRIVDAGVDVRVYLQSAYPNPATNRDFDTGICIEAPLGNGGCPLSDNNPPLFSHLADIIGSDSALPRLVWAFDQWSPIIREDAQTHVVVVTDDDSRFSPEEFDDLFTALDDRLESYVFHAITPLMPCESAARVGETYIELADQTGGVVGDLCSQSFDPIFDRLSAAVVDGADVACVFDLPVPPQGWGYDPDGFEVRSYDGANEPTVIEPLDSGLGCLDGGEGWFVDDDSRPGQVAVCPETCRKLRALPFASVHIGLSCEPLAEG